MLALKILCIMLGIAFTIFGYLIRFKKKYNLINGFQDDFKSGRKAEKYAICVGTVEFAVGIVFLAVGLSLIIFC